MNRLLPARTEIAELKRAGEIVIFDSTATALHDVARAAAVYAIEQDIGMQVHLA